MNRTDPLQVFLSYAREDSVLRQQLRDHLSLLERLQKIEVWDDGSIEPGTEWEGEIHRQLEKADVIVLLISVDFIKKDFCWCVEMDRAIQRHELGACKILPLLGRAVACWEDAPFARFQIFPRDRRPVTQWDDRDTALSEVVNEVKRLADEWRPVELRPVPVAPAQPILTAAPLEAPGGDSPSTVYCSWLESLSRTIPLPLPEPVGGLSEHPIDKLYTHLPIEILRPQRDFPNPHSAETPKPRTVTAQQAKPSSVLDTGNIVSLFDAHRQRLLFTEGYDSAARYGAKTLGDGLVTSLETRLTPGRRMVLLGDPGSGKSTLIRWLRRHRAQAWLDDVGGDPHRDETEGAPSDGGRASMPVFLSCREIPPSAIGDGIEDLFGAIFRRTQQPAEWIGLLVQEVVHHMSRGRVVLLIDGLDEIQDIKNRRAFCQQIRRIGQAYPRVSMLISSRVLGFEAMGAQFGNAFELARIADLRPEDKRAFCRRWAHLAYQGAAAESHAESLSELVNGSRAIARITENVLILTLLAQMENLGSLPDRRLDIYHRTVNLLVSRRSFGEDGDLMLAEVAPQLQFLAYKMRRLGRQQIRHDEALAAFAESREVMVDIPELRRRKPEALLLAVEESGLLVRAGVETRFGIDRPVYQFFHQSFQEYFAGQAIRYGTVPEPAISEDVRERLIQLLETLEVKERPVQLFGRQISEKVVAESWQESLRFCIADLGEQEADEVFLLILLGKSTDPGEMRARAGFAAACLAEEPRVGEATVDAVVEALLDHADWGIDGSTADRRTSFDQAVHALGGSKYGERLRRRLIDGMMERVGRARGVACKLYFHARASEQMFLLDQEDAVTEAFATLDHSDAPRRAIAALGLMDAFFRGGGQFADRPPEQVQTWINALLERVNDPSEAVAFTALWALAWLTGAKIEDPAETVQLSETQLEPIVSFLKRDAPDPLSVRYACLLISPAGVLSSQEDHFYEWARIGQGERPWAARPEVQKAETVFRESDTVAESDAVLLNILRGSPEAEAREAAAIALARRGLYPTESIDGLAGAYRDEALAMETRAEALLSLAIAGGAHAGSVIWELFRERLEQSDDSLTLLLFLCLIGVGDRDMLAGVETSLGDLDPPTPYLSVLRRLNGSTTPKPRNIKSSIVWTSIARRQDLPLVERYLASSNRWSLFDVKAKEEGTLRAAWYFLCVPKNQKSQFQEAMDAGPFDLADHGRIIASGFGDAIPEDLRTKVLGIWPT